MSETLQKELQVAQVRLSELATEYRRVSETISRKEHEQRMATLTLKQLDELPTDAAVYRTIGKAFMKSDMSQVKDRLKSVTTNSTGERESLVARKMQLEGSILQAEQKTKSLYQELRANQ